MTQVFRLVSRDLARIFYPIFNIRDIARASDRSTEGPFSAL